MIPVAFDSADEALSGVQAVKTRKVKIYTNPWYL